VQNPVHEQVEGWTSERQMAVETKPQWSFVGPFSWLGGRSNFATRPPLHLRAILDVWHAASPDSMDGCKDGGGSKEDPVEEQVNFQDLLQVWLTNK
jgi:hypothetical protein